MTAASSHHLPGEINADTMVIRSERGLWRHALDVVLTLFAWVFFTYLFARGIREIALTGHVGVDMPLLSRLQPALTDLGVYVLAMFLQGSLLIVWARYNLWRFRGKQRRANTSPVAPSQLQAFYGVDTASLHQLRTQPICVIAHREDGSIADLEFPPTRPQVQVKQPLQPQSPYAAEAQTDSRGEPTDTAVLTRR